MADNLTLDEETAEVGADPDVPEVSNDTADDTSTPAPVEAAGFGGTGATSVLALWLPTPARRRLLDADVDAPRSHLPLLFSPERAQDRDDLVGLPPAQGVLVQG
jgi:hypothetical protein